MSKKYQIICNIPFPQGAKISYPFFTLTATAGDFEEARDIVERFRGQYENVETRICDQKGLGFSQQINHYEKDSPKSISENQYASSKQIGYLDHALSVKGEDLTDWCIKHGFTDQYHIPKQLAWSMIKELKSNNGNNFSNN